ncbi:mitochondrial cardiolipin hydrolase [Uranotaenia lowii]|uniref:mitochondrial cardiolipin hydrolase n=1 Tax=Uranotaenia lowii TaxID=190385 RepID=UPI00247A98DD|nr:mitochondrial cardiolipin hydrolase [Uranotaenia lowii]
MFELFSSVPRWVRVSALMLGIGLGSEVMYEGYLSWRSWCAGRRARQRASQQMIEVYFANERSSQPDTPGTTMASFTTEHIRRIVSLLDRARVSVNLCMYICTVESIGDALLRATKRGVQVRIVGCSSMAYSSGSQMMRLVQGGIPVRFNGQNVSYLMHHKFCLIDTDWLCDRCYHEERERKNGYCCDASSVGAGAGAGDSGAPATPATAGRGARSGSRKPQCNLQPPSDSTKRQGCVRCNRKRKCEVEK